MPKRSKYNTTLMKKARAELVYEEEQKRLHEKYVTVDENKEIIEKSNYLKVVISGLVFWTIIIILVFFVFCGVCSLVFEGPREELIAIFNSAIEYMKS